MCCVNFDGKLQSPKKKKKKKKLVKISDVPAVGKVQIPVFIPKG